MFPLVIGDYNLPYNYQQPVSRTENPYQLELNIQKILHTLSIKR
jgi:hypothetical protein